MKDEFVSGITLTVMIGLVASAFAGVTASHQNDIEALAMASLGYHAMKTTAPFPKDKYAMPDPYSSEPLMTYEYKGSAPILTNARKFANAE